MAFTRFMDMLSNGSKKTPYDYIYIEADEDIAAEVFEKVFNECPYDVACECCGQNFSVYEFVNLEAATEYDRRGISLETWLNNPRAKVIYTEDFPE